MKCTLPSLNLDTPLLQIGVSAKNQLGKTNSVDPDEMACYMYEPSHLDLYCLQRFLCWSTGMKG